MFARDGGEEFAVVLNDIDVDEARSTAERMRRAVSELLLVTGVFARQSIG